MYHWVRDPALIRVPGTGTHDTLAAWLLTHPDLRRMEGARVFAGMIAKAIGEQSDKACGAQLAASG